MKGFLKVPELWVQTIGPLRVTVRELDDCCLWKVQGADIVDSGAVATKEEAAQAGLETAKATFARWAEACNSALKDILPQPENLALESFKVYYFGTDTRQHGHYWWSSEFVRHREDEAHDLGNNYTGFAEKHYRESQPLVLKYINLGHYGGLTGTMIGCQGSILDRRGGTSTVFYTPASVSAYELTKAAEEQFPTVCAALEKMMEAGKWPYYGPDSKFQDQEERKV